MGRMPATSASPSAGAEFPAGAYGRRLLYALDRLERWSAHTHFIANAATGQTRDFTPGKYDAPTFQLSGPLQYDFSPDSKDSFTFQIMIRCWLRPPTMTSGSFARRPGAKPRNFTASNPAYEATRSIRPTASTSLIARSNSPATSRIFFAGSLNRDTPADTVLTDVSQLGR